jgi:hypothetical protein
MKLLLKENDKPNLKKTEMICDIQLHEKLNKYDLSKFLNKHSTNLLIGSAGQGKTSLLLSFFKSKELMKGVYHNIYIFQPTASGQSIKNNIFDKIPDEQKYNELTEENLLEVMDNIKGEDKKYNNCIIFDDMTAYLKGNPEIERLLKELIYNRRHYRTSVYFLVQSYVSVPLQIRKLFSNIFCFKVSRKELEKIQSELMESIPNDCLNDLSKFVFDKPHEYLFMNIESQRMFKKWDEILIE